MASEINFSWLGFVGFEVAEMSSMALTKRIFRMQVWGGTWGNVHISSGGEADLEGSLWLEAHTPEI